MAADDYHMISKHGKTAATTAVSPNSIKKPKERVPAKPDMPEVNRFLMCQLCSGYLIDATAIVECQHTFCKSCILKYLDTNSYCPICDVQLNKAKPHLSLRSDVIIQRLVYKLVPGLLVSEIRRRRDFSIKNGMDSVEAAELASNSIAEEIEAALDLSTVLSLDDVVSLSVEYFRSGEDRGSLESSSKVPDTNGKPPQSSASTSSPSSATTQSSQNQQQTQQQQQKSNVKSNTVNSSGGGSSSVSTSANTIALTECDGNSNSSEQANDRRYLQCPAAVSVGLLKKFIRMKYGLSDDYRVDLLYNGDRDSILENDLTLLDVAFIFKWNKDEPMKFHYRIFERPSKTLTVYSGIKRPAPSMMDEPPDDDTASGSHNRSSMYSSSSSAPSSKLPRLADNTSTSGSQGSVSKGNTSGKSTTTSTPTASSAPATDKKDDDHDDDEDDVGDGSKIKSKATSSSKPSIKVEKEEVEEDDDDDEDEEDYELVERKEHMKGIKSSRKNSIRESLKRSVAASNLRLHVSSRSTHSTDTKGSSVESERESRNENSLKSSSTSVKPKVGSGKGRGRPPKSVDSLKLRVSSTSSDQNKADHQAQSTGSLKLSITKSGVTPVVSSASASAEKKEPLKLSLGSVLANKGSKSPDRKHHKHKHHHHHHHKLRHRDKQSKGVTSTAQVASIQQNSQKPLKISFTLSPPSGQGNQGNQSQNVMIKESTTASEVKEQQKGRPLSGNQNFNNSARTSASAHGHLNNISKSISVSSVNPNANSGGNNTTTSNTSGNSNVKGNQYGNKVLSPAELIPKNTGIEIQPTTIPVSLSSHNQISQHSMQQSGNSGGVSSNNNTSNSHKHSHPLLPDSVHVPKSVTLIPVNPNHMNMPSSQLSSSGKGNTSSSQEKGGSGSQSNQNRINAHTFTHPITNKSLHQITVTEVPPPQQKNNGGGMGSSISTSSMNNSSSGNNAPHSSISGTTSNPIEKVIANAANNKPQFNGPGSMEITKIYCGAPGLKENPAKKLKDRKGLDISITGTGINVSVNKSSQKLEETLRQKVNIAIGGGSGSISVTPAPNTLGSGNNAGNKIKSAAATAASLLSGKMPPGITIGPATVPTSSANSNSSNNAGNSNNNASSSNNNSMASANAGNNIMKGLGFTLPPHLTAHPHNPNSNLNKNLSGNQGKSDNKIGTTTLSTQNSRLLGKDSISIIGKGNVVQNMAGGQQQQQPPPVEITISAAASGTGNKSQTNITNRGISITSNNPKSKMNNDPLTSILDITQGLRKSPTGAINNANAKDFKGMIALQQQNSSNIPLNSSSVPSNNKNFAGNKRPFEMTNASQQSTGNNNKKTVKESPEAKRGRSASTSSDSSSTTSTKPSGEIPLDLSGRSTRTTPPLNIPHPQPREPSKSPTAPPPPAVEKRASTKSPETAKPGIVITPPASTAAGAPTTTTSTNNFLSPKTNVNQKNVTEALNKGQSIKSISVSKLSPNQSKISSIVDSLAQKQAQAQQQQNIKNSQQQQQQQQQNLKNSQQQQQQQQQNLKNSQQQQLQNNMKNSQQQQQQNMKNSQQQQQQQQHQNLQNVKNSQNQQQQQYSHHHHPPSNATSSNLNKNQNNSNSHVHSSSGNNNASSNTQNMKTSPSNSNKSSSGLTSPITATPGIPMTSPSPPGTIDHMRNLWETAARQGKMNEFLAGLYSPTGHPSHSMTGAAAVHQMFAAAAAAAAAGGSPSGGPALNASMFAQFGHHLAGLGGTKIPPGMFDPHLMAAFNAHAHNAHPGMRMHHPFVGSMSPPLSLNAFFPPHGGPSAGGQQQSSMNSASGAPPPPAAAGAGANQTNLKIPNVPLQKPAINNVNNSTGGSGKSNLNPFAPLFSHSVPVTSPKSPNNQTNLNLPHGSAKSPASGASPSNPILPFASTATSSPSTASTQDQKHLHSSSGKSQSGSSHHHHHHHHDSSSTHSSSSSSAGSNKSTKINGTMSTAMPVFPPGIHNPLLPSRNSSNTSSSNSNSSGNSLQSGSSASNSSSILNKSFTSPLHPTNNLSKNTMKGGIPNSMKISNFLPNKPKDSTSDANAEATITSGSNFGMPSLQAKPNFSLSPTRAPATDSLINNSIIPSVNIPKSPLKEGSLSPVKQLSSQLAGAGANKPSSLTCASLLLPDYSKPSHNHHQQPHPHHSPHLLNSLSPTKGDLGLSLNRSNRTPSSDSILLSPTKTSPGASPSSAFSKTSSNKDGFRSEAHGHSKTISPTKDEVLNSKKEIGNIPTGPQAGIGGLPLARNFPLPTSPVHNTQSLTLNRPIPTIPAFLNRSSNNSGAMSSSNSIVSQHHHHHPLTSQTLPSSSPHHHKTSPNSVNKSPKSPVKPHLPSPVFPFPGVSVPVQVKLQDDEIPVPPSTSQQVSLKSEVNKLLAAKEEKMENRRKSTEQTLGSRQESPTKSFSSSSNSSPLSPPVSKKSKCESPLIKENLNENPPAKVEKVDTQKASCSSVKNEKEKENSPITPILDSKSSSSSESKNAENGNTGKSKEASEKNESESIPREFKAGEGEQERKREDGADPSNSKKYFASDSSTVAVAVNFTESPCKIEAKALSPVKSTVEVSTEKVSTAEQPLRSSPPPSTPVTISPTATAPVTIDKALVEKQTEEKSVEKDGEVEDISIIEEKKSETQIVLDVEIRKSDETSAQVNIEESNGCKIPQDPGTGQITNNECVVETPNIDDEADDVDVDVDIEMEDEPKDHDALLGQSEKQEMEMDVCANEVDDNQMDIDVEGNEEKMDVQEEVKNVSEESENLVIEERLTLTKEEEDVDVDVDVGVDDPLDVSVDEVMEQTETTAEEKPVEVDEPISIDDDEQELVTTPMEVGENSEHNNHENDNINATSELIESQPETTLPSVIDNNQEKGDMEEAEENVDEEKLSKDSVEMPSDVIKRQKLETSEESHAEQESVMENEEKFEESSFFVENETSNLSQDDSECGELVIDLGPSEEQEVDDEQSEEKEENDNNDDDATLELEVSSKQDSQWKESEKVTSEACEYQQEKEEEIVEETSTQEISTSQVNDQPSTSPINMNMESNEKEIELKVHAELPTAPEAVHVESKITSDEPSNNALDGLNQNSISNQIPINSESIEVNGLIKPEEESSQTVYLEKPASPQVDASQCVLDLAEDSIEKEKETDEPKENDENTCLEENVSVDVLNEANNSQLDNDIPASDNATTAPSSSSTVESENAENSKTCVDTLLPAQVEKTIEEEQVVKENQENVENVLPAAECPTASPETNDSLHETGAISEETTPTPVHIPEEDNEIAGENITLVSDDNPMHVEEAPETEKIDEEETLIIIEEQSEENLDVSEAEPVPEMKNELMEIQCDSVSPPGGNSECEPLSNNANDKECSTPSLIDGKDEEDSQTTDNNDVTTEVNNDNVDVAVISATITTASAAAVVAATSTDINSVDSSSVSVSSSVTPTTTSTASLAIKLDIAANDDDLGCSTNAESLLPSGISPSNTSQNPSSNFTSVSSLASPSSSSSSSSSPSSSHVNTANSPAAAASTGLKSLETFGKVAAGFLASATSTINNNNNNTSLAPTSCDAISIATTNANA